jgi:hypothetical protein
MKKLFAIPQGTALVISLALTIAMLVATTTSSSAAADGGETKKMKTAQIERRADSCGSGYHKQSNGELAGSRTAKANGRTAKASISGYVRFCTRERTARPDQRDQRVLVGVPKHVISTATFAGPRYKVCLKQTIYVHIKRIQTGSISFSGATPGASVSINDDVVKHSVRLCDRPEQRRIVFDQSSLRVTAPNGHCWITAGGGPIAACYVGPVVNRVVVETFAQIYYRVNRTTKLLQALQQETDYSARS